MASRLRRLRDIPAMQRTSGGGRAIFLVSPGLIQCDADASTALHRVDAGAALASCTNAALVSTSTRGRSRHWTMSNSASRFEPPREQSLPFFAHMDFKIATLSILIDLSKGPRGLVRKQPLTASLWFHFVRPSNLRVSESMTKNLNLCHV